MQKKYMKRILCMLLTLALLFAQFPVTPVFAETVDGPEVVNFEWSDDTKTQLDMHNSGQTIPLVDFANLFGWTNPLDMVIRISKDGEVVFALTDIVTDLKQILTGGLSLEVLAEIGITLDGNAQYSIEKGNIKLGMDGWRPTYSITWSEGPEFSTKIFDNLTVNSNKADLVIVNGTTVTDSSTVKVYRGTTPSVVVGMGELVNYTVSAAIGEDVVLTEAGTYTFVNGLTADTVMDVVYVEDTESQISLGRVSGLETVEFPVTAQAESTVTVKITPDAGYYVKSVSVKNGDEEVDVKGDFENGVLTLTFTTGASKAHYIIDCVTDPVVVLNGNSVAYNETMELDEVKRAIYARIDRNASAPIFDNIDGMIFEYNSANIGNANWNSLDYNPEGLSLLTAHAFGSNEKETVRISYTSNDPQFANGSIIFEITLVDERNANAAIDVHETAVVTYGAFTNEDVLAQLLDGCNGVYDMETNELIAGATLHITTDLTKLIVGEHDVVVKFDGNAEYAECEKTVKVTITVAPADITVTSQQIKPNQGMTINSMITVAPENAGRIAFVMGLDAVNEASVIKIDVSNMLHVPETLRPAVDAILNTVNNKTVTLEELEELMKQVGELDDRLDLTYVTKAIEVLRQVEGLEGIGQLQVTLSTDGNIDTSNVGAYLVGAMISDVNYEFDVDFGYLVIIPDATKVTLAFNDEIAPIITLEEIQNCIYDMGAHVVETEHDAANDKIVNVFCGITETGDVYVENTAPTMMGAYTQITYIHDIGNVMYYAMPIARAYAITPALANVVFVDEAGNTVDMYEFVYDGQAKTTTAIAVHKDGTVLDSAKLTYKYVGVCTDATVYESADAPSKPGVYTVMALYQDADKEIYGAAFAPMIIEQAASQFGANNVEVEFDGNEKFIDIVNPNALAYLSIIVDGQNVNMLIPEEWGIDAMTIPVEEIVAEIFGLMEQMPEIPEIPEVEETMSKLADILNNIKDYQVKVNGTKPSEAGVYDIFALAFGVNHKTTLVEATLTITKPVEEPTDPSEPEEPVEPEEPENTCECCDDCTGAEGCECFCGECDFCEKTEAPEDPEEPTCGCCDTCTDSDDCECHCGECDFCEKPEEPKEPVCGCCDKCTDSEGCECFCGECDFCEKPTDPSEPVEPEEPENTCECCEDCTGEDGCTCKCGECDFCEKDPVDPSEPEEPVEPEEPENTCECCADCTGAEGCECLCGECDFCEKPPVDPEDPTDPTDPSEPVEPEEPENTCKCCDKCTGKDGCTCECGECDFCEKKPTDPEEPEDPEDPTDPADPTDPTDPSEPSDPTKPTDPSKPDDDKDDVDDPKLGDDPKNNSLIFFGVIGLALAALAVEVIILFKNKREEE